MMRHVANIFLSLLATILLSACGGKKEGKQLGSQGSSADSSTPAYIVDKSTASDYLKSVGELYLPWQQLKVPVSVKLNAPKSLSISGTAEMVRDSSVFISLKFIGMEVAWLYVSNDNIILADKMNKRYISESPARFLGGFKVTTSNIQDLLIGRPFVLGYKDFKETVAEQFTLTSDGSGAWSLQPLSTLENLEYGFWFEPHMELNATVVQYAGKKPVALLYGKPVDTPFGPMASQLNLKADLNQTNIDLTIFWNWQRAKWGTVFSPRQPKIPDNYKRVDGQSVIKSLINHQQ